MGFCLFNNIAVAAAARVARGLSRVAIVDIDVHHGNGTQWMFYDDPAVLYVSTHQFPFYPGTGDAPPRPARAGARLHLQHPAGAGATDADYAAAYERVAARLVEYAPSCCWSPQASTRTESDPLASMRVTAPGYAAVVQSLADRRARWAARWRSSPKEAKK